MNNISSNVVILTTDEKNALENKALALGRSRGLSELITTIPIEDWRLLKQCCDLGFSGQPCLPEQPKRISALIKDIIEYYPLPC